MARRGTDTTAIPRRRNATVAAATRIKLDDRKASKSQASKRAEWQSEAWEYFDDVPEIKYSTWYSGNVISKLRLFVAVQPDDLDASPIPATDPASGIPIALAQRAEAELARLHGELGGLPEILRSLNMNLDIAAEAYLIGIGPRERVETDPNDPGVELVIVEPEDWFVASIDEVKIESDTYKYENLDGKWVELDAERDTIIRVWQRHPRTRNKPDNNMRGILSDCEALLLLTNQVKAEAKARQNAGILTVPNELSFGADDADDDVAPEGEEGEEATTDSFSEELLRAMTDPIADPSSAAAVMPLVIRGPSEHLKPDVLRHIKLDRGDATNVLEERITARVTRIARGINLPVEVVMGHQQTTYANAEQVDEDTFEDHFEPRALLLVDVLTVGFLHPQLDDAGEDPDLVDRMFVWFDPSDVVGEPDPIESADYGLDNGLISEQAWRRVKNWTEDDAPDPLELLIRSGLRRGILTADLTRALLELLGISIDVEPLPQAPDPNATTDNGAAARDLIRTALLMVASHRNGNGDGHVPDATEPKALSAATRRHETRAQAGRRIGRRLSQIDRELRTRLLVAANAAITRALEKAGNKLKNAAGPTRQQLKSVLPVYAAATLGPTLTAQAGFSPDDLIDTEWAGLEQQFMQWGAQAQDEALAAANELVGFSAAQRDALGLRQSADLKEAWSWFREALTALGRDRLFAPDGTLPTVGEFDPTSKVPTGLVREAIARAGGAQGIEPVGDNLFVSVHNGGQPLGGIGTGDLLRDAMADEGAEVEAYEWVYGAAYRAHPFEEHVALDGLIFGDFGDRQLAADASWVSGDEYFPGDHAGCACDFVVILLAPEDFGQTTQGPNG